MKENDERDLRLSAAYDQIAAAMDAFIDVVTDDAHRENLNGKQTAIGVGVILAWVLDAAITRNQDKLTAK